jgi:TolB-like protein
MFQAALLSMVSGLGVTNANLPVDAPPVPRTLAILTLEASLGVDPQLAGVITQTLADDLRAAGVFSRITTTQEIDNIMGFEQQKQLLNCESSSCMAEIAGALGVTHVLMGQLARIGARFVLNVRLFDVKRGQVVGSVTQHVRGESAEVVFDVLKPATLDLLGQAGFLPKVASGPPAGGAAPLTHGTGARDGAQPTATQAVGAAATTKELRSGPRWGLVAGGGAGVAVGAVAVIVAVVGAMAGALSTVHYLGFVYVDTRSLGLTGDAKFWVSVGVPLMSFTVVAFSALVALVGLLGGGGLSVGGFLL